MRYAKAVVGDRRVHPLIIQPYRAGPKAGEVGPEDTLKRGRSGDHSRRLGDQI